MFKPWYEYACPTCGSPNMIEGYDEDYSDDDLCPDIDGYECHHCGHLHLFTECDPEDWYTNIEIGLPRPKERPSLDELYVERFDPSTGYKVRLSITQLLKEYDEGYKGTHITTAIQLIGHLKEILNDD